MAVAGQMELATLYDVPRRRSGAASVVALVLNIAVGGLMALAAPPLLPARLESRFLPALLLLAGVLHPRVFAALLNRGLRLVRRAPLDEPLRGGGVGRAALWGAASWLLLGLHVWALCRDVGATGPVLALATTGFAAAWIVGFVVVIAPAGFGPREAVLVAVLGGSLAGGSGAAGRQGSRDAARTGLHLTCASRRPSPLPQRGADPARGALVDPQGHRGDRRDHRAGH